MLSALPFPHVHMTSSYGQGEMGKMASGVPLSLSRLLSCIYYILPICLSLQCMIILRYTLIPVQLQDFGRWPKLAADCPVFIS